MRHLFLILLIALLPLRGAISDAMATGMVTAQVQQQTAAEMVSVDAHEDGVQTHQDIKTVVADISRTAADCSGHSSGGDEHADDTHCNSCSLCQACHMVVLLPTAGDVIIALNPNTLPGAVIAQFDSAEHALSKKPPIY